MWLLNIKTRALELFHGDNVPEYAILSHRWTDSEVSFQSIQSRRYRYTGRWPPKLEGARKKAKEHGYNYIWVDTCCIDKTSSSELEEAINSMFQWYNNAAICYAYLPDVTTGDTPLIDIERSKFRSSSWFTRGWTLQELIAPKKLYFYDSRWKYIGSKGEMSHVIESITGIPRAIVVGVRDPRQASIAQRMSWAANRVTTRKEDMAYSLLGLFGLTMPMIYGEGDKAFTRLQEEIKKDSADISILAGASIFPSEEYFPSYDLFLATSPSDFGNCGRVIACSAYNSKSRDHSISEVLDHEGVYKSQKSVADLYFTCPVFGDPKTGQNFAVLSCCLEDNAKVLVGIPILTTTAEPQRVLGSSVESISSRLGLIPRASVEFNKGGITIAGRRGVKETSQSHPTQDWWFLKSSIESHGFKMIEFEPSTIKVANAIRLLQSGSPQEIGPLQKLLLRYRDTRQLGSDFVAGIWFPGPSEPDMLCSALKIDRNTPLRHLADILTTTDFRSCDEKMRFGASYLHVSVGREFFDRGTIYAVRISASPGTESSEGTRTIGGNGVRPAMPQSFDEAEPHPTTSVAHDDPPPPSQSGAAVWPRLILPFLAAIFSPVGSWTFACMLAPLLLCTYWEGTPIVLLQVTILLLHCIWVSLI
jgi:hypothetical protein